MVGIGIRLLNAAIEGVLEAPIMAIVDGTIGFIYGKWAHLPVDAVAKAWIVWGVVEHALLQIALAFSENEIHQKFIQCTIFALSTAIGIHELRKKGLMGDKMMYFIIAYKAFVILGLCDVLDKLNETLDDIANALEKLNEALEENETRATEIL